MLTQVQRDQRAHYKNLIDHRSDADGKPKKGYTHNVEMLRKEIAKLDALEKADGAA